MPNISDEVLWSAISAVVVGFVLKTTEFFINRRSAEDDGREARINLYHESLEDELQSLREDNRSLRIEVNKYRKLYSDLFDELYGTEGFDTPEKDL
jgi:hypothetical protein